MGHDTHKYPDLEADGLGDLKSIKRIQGMGKTIPQIRWGDAFKDWPIERRLDFAKRVASAQNHAAHLLHKERDALLDVCVKQEKQIESLQRANASAAQTAHQEIQRQGAERQELYSQIVKAKAEIKRLANRVRELEAEGADG